jgi:hypothetical protein
LLVFNTSCARERENKIILGKLEFCKRYKIIIQLILGYNSFWLVPMFVEREVSYSAGFTFLVMWHASAVSLPPGDVILAQLACPLNDVIFIYIGNK